MSISLNIHFDHSVVRFNYLPALHPDIISSTFIVAFVLAMTQLLFQTALF